MKPHYSAMFQSFKYLPFALTLQLYLSEILDICFFSGITMNSLIIMQRTRIKCYFVVFIMLEHFHMTVFFSFQNRLYL